MRRAVFVLTKILLYVDIAVALASAAALFASSALARLAGWNPLGDGPWFLRLLVVTVAAFLGAPVLMIPYLMAKDALAREAEGAK